MGSAPLGGCFALMLVAVALPRVASAPDMPPPPAPPLGMSMGLGHALGQGLGLPLPLGQGLHGQGLGPMRVPADRDRDWDRDTNRDASRNKPSCEEARLKCAYRTGCGRALQSYIVGCSALHHSPPGHCPEACQHALIALTSTDEGKDLMTCQCADELCEETKQRVEVCRPAVMGATRSEAIVSCRVAQWICGADAECSTALEYYHRFCKAMFRGHKCTRRCKNSISILRKQEKAAKLDSCWCDGREDYDCPSIRSNMARLCFHQEPPVQPPVLPGDVDTNELLPKQSKGGAAAPGVGSVLLVALSLSWSLCTALAAVAAP